MLPNSVPNHSSATNPLPQTHILTLLKVSFTKHTQFRSQFSFPKHSHFRSINHLPNHLQFHSPIQVPQTLAVTHPSSLFPKTQLPSLIQVPQTLTVPVCIILTFYYHVYDLFLGTLVSSRTPKMWLVELDSNLIWGFPLPVCALTITAKHYLIHPIK